MSKKGMEYTGEVIYKIPMNHEGVFLQEEFEHLIVGLSICDCSPSEFFEYVMSNSIIEECVMHR